MLWKLPNQLPRKTTWNGLAADVCAWRHAAFNLLLPSMSHIVTISQTPLRPSPFGTWRHLWTTQKPDYLNWPHSRSAKTQAKSHISAVNLCFWIECKFYSLNYIMLHTNQQQKYKYWPLGRSNEWLFFAHTNWYPTSCAP